MNQSKADLKMTDLKRVESPHAVRSVEEGARAQLGSAGAVEPAVALGARLIAK